MARLTGVHVSPTVLFNVCHVQVTPKMVLTKYRALWKTVSLVVSPKISGMNGSRRIAHEERKAMHSFGASTCSMMDEWSIVKSCQFADTWHRFRGNMALLQSKNSTAYYHVRTYSFIAHCCVEWKRGMIHKEYNQVVNDGKSPANFPVSNLERYKNSREWTPCSTNALRLEKFRISRQDDHVFRIQSHHIRLLRTISGK